jgi:GTP-binding protein Era
VSEETPSGGEGGAPPRAEPRCGLVAVVGAPNAGKSTLVNALAGAKVTIVSPKPQTTRFRIRAVVMRGPSQIVLVDTPGIFAPRRRLDRAMVAAAWGGAQDADLTLLIVDSRAGLTDPVRAILERLAKGPYLFPEDELSDLPNRMLVAEIVREQILRLTHEEVPHHATVETENWEERKDGSVRVDCTVYVGRATQKAILIGDGGARIKAIGSRARRELEALLERRVHLFLNVKDRPGWDEERGRLRALGLEDLE